MSNLNLKDAFQTYKNERDFDRPTTMRIIEDVFRTLLKKKYGNDEGFELTVNAEKGDLVIYRNRMIVADDQDYNELTEIPFSKAQEIAPDYEIGEQLYEEITLDDFGRRSALAAKQTIASKINELKKMSIIKKYTERVGEIVNAEVYQVWKKEVLLIDDEGNELILPKEYQIPKDHYKKGDIVKAVIERVENKNGLAQIIISRTSTTFIAKLIENEVPEIFDGIIIIKKIVREPGERAKIAVETFDDRIDPVGACVGIKGSRIHGIVKELRNENIDIVNFTNNIQLYLTRSLSPAKISSMDIDRENKSVKVYLKQDQVSLAIGKRGTNINLASKLTGYKIDVLREGVELEDEYDIPIDEFRDVIDDWIVEVLKEVGCDTARSILQLPKQELEKRTDLEKVTIDEIYRILNEEFEKGE